MNDTQFLTKIIGEICDYAVSNGMEPNDTLSTIADNIKMLLEISTFNGWQYKNPEGQVPETGHWIYLQDCANEGIYCSECHTKMFDHYPMKKKLSRFCAHCGVKMDEEVEGR